MRQFVIAVIEDTLDENIGIIEANDGEEAIKLLEKNRGAIQWLLTDWEMPNLTGTDLLSQVQKSPELTLPPSIIWTGGYLDNLKLELTSLAIIDVPHYEKLSEPAAIKTMFQKHFPKLFLAVAA